MKDAIKNAMQNVSFITDSDINFFCKILSLSEILLDSFSIEVLLLVGVEVVLLEVLTPGLETILGIFSFSVLLLVFNFEVFFSLLLLLITFFVFLIFSFRILLFLIFLFHSLRFLDCLFYLLFH